MSVTYLMSGKPASLTPEQYHADRTRLSNTALGYLLESPAKYDWWRSGMWERDSTKALEFGSYVDAAILRDGPVGSGVAIATKDVLAKNGQKRGKRWDAFKALHAGKQVIKEDEPLAFMLDSLKGHGGARSLIEAEGDYQRALEFWVEVEDETFGECLVECKALLDKLVWPGDDEKPEYIVDLKTSRDPSPQAFAKSVVNFGYHRQAAWYQRAVQCTYEVDLLPFVFIVLGTEPPYSCEVYDLSEDFFELGRQEVELALHRYAKCSLTGLWQSPTAGQITTLDPPAFAYSNLQWSA